MSCVGYGWSCIIGSYNCLCVCFSCCSFSSSCFFFFFFSSRRRHTRLTCDWSSDVCSSDLSVPADRERAHQRRGPLSRTRGSAGLSTLPGPSRGGLPRRRAVDAPRHSQHCRSEETRLNSSHMSISYAVFCLKKKKKKKELAL